MNYNKNVFTKIVGEFKEFISRGNVMDMAVGIVVGGAFTSVIKSLVNDVIMPFVGAILLGMDFHSLGFNIPWGEKPYVNVGGFVTNVITFLLTALCIFILVKTINAIRSIRKKEEEIQEEILPPNEIALLTEIRDLLLEQNKQSNDNSNT